MWAGRFAASEKRVDPGQGSRRSGRACPLPIALAVLVSLACGPSAEKNTTVQNRPNVVLISMDTTRADHLSAYGYARSTSPRLRALAEQGTRLEVVYSPSATTGPSHASLFTGLPPIAHGVRKNGLVLDASYATLAERLSDLGYETGAVVSSYVLNHRFGYDQGFSVFDDDFSLADTPEGTTLWEGEAIEGHFYGSAGDTTRRALDWLHGREHPERPFFLFVHYFDPHDPYLPPAGFQPPFAVTRKEALKINRSIFLYDTLIAYTDREIGRLLDGLDEDDLSDDTLLIVTGDHGEGLMAHGHMYHGMHVYEEAVRVPLIVRWPGRVPPGRVVRTPFALVDLGPTILGLLGDEGRGALRPRGLESRLLGEDADSLDASRPIFLYRRHYSGEEDLGPGLHAVGEKFGVREGRWKLIEGPEEGTLELFDLEADPQEKINLAAKEPEQTARLRALIVDWRANYAAAGAQVPPLSEVDRERLRTLGYVE